MAPPSKVPKPATPLAVVCSDSHLQARAWKIQGIHGDSYFSFRQIIDHAIANCLPVIGAGDMIDKRVNEPEPIVFLKKECERLSNAGQILYYTQGQHELDEIPWFELAGTSVHLHKRQIQLGKLKIYGLDYQPAGAFKPELDLIPEDTDVLVCHQVFEDFMGDICLPQGAFADIPHVKTVITGDFHETRYEKFSGRQGQEMRVFSPGSGCMQEISEPPEKYFGVLMSNGSIKRVPLLTRHFTEWPVLHNEDDLEEFLAGFGEVYEQTQTYAVGHDLPEELRKPLLRITMSSRLAESTRRINKLVADRAHIFYKELPAERSESQILENVPNLRKGEAITLATMLPQAVDQEKEPNVYNLSQRLLSAEDVQLELVRWKQELLKDDD